MPYFKNTFFIDSLTTLLPDNRDVDQLIHCTGHSNVDVKNRNRIEKPHNAFDVS